MIREFCNERYTLLEEELSLYADMGILPVKKLSGALACVTKALDDLKAYIMLHPFASDEEEIHFFKYEKPRFFAHQIFLLEQFTIESQKPIEDADLLRSYYQDELKFVLRFFEQYKFQYGYFQADATELDDKYCLRKAGPVSMIMPVLPDRDPEFSTNADYLFAKFIAYERLQNYLIGAIYHPEPQTDAGEAAFKILCKLSGDQIGIFLKACDDNRVIVSKSLSLVFRSIVPYLSTDKKTQLSWASMRKSSYQFEKADVEVVIATLEKLIARIREYY